MWGPFDDLIYIGELSAKKVGGEGYLGTNSEWLWGLPLNRFDIHVPFGSVIGIHGIVCYHGHRAFNDNFSCYINHNIGMDHVLDQGVNPKAELRNARDTACFPFVVAADYIQK